LGDRFVDVRAGVGDDAVVPLFLRPITLHRDERVRRNPGRSRDGLQDLEAWVTRFMLLSMAKDSGVAIVPNLSRASYSCKNPAFLTAEDQQFFRLYQVLSRKIRTKFGQP
jgi:hypothetical protein